MVTWRESERSKFKKKTLNSRVNKDDKTHWVLGTDYNDYTESISFHTPSFICLLDSSLFVSSGYFFMLTHDMLTAAICKEVFLQNENID